VKLTEWLRKHAVAEPNAAVRPPRCGQAAHIAKMDILETPDATRILEAALLCSHQPMSLREMRQLFDDTVSADGVLAMLGGIREQWSGRGVELVEVGTGWRFQTRPDVQAHLDRLNPEKPPKYSRATLETLAIVAYKQPVTRGDIEDIRGVTVSSHIVKQLEDRGWVEVIGHRDAPGRPALFATTRQFLDDMGLSSLAQLPTLDGLPVSQALLPGLDPEPAPEAVDVAANELAPPDQIEPFSPSP
jgi:segregation and condensation protein B